MAANAAVRSAAEAAASRRIGAAPWRARRRRTAGSSARRCPARPGRAADRDGHDDASGRPAPGRHRATIAPAAQPERRTRVGGSARPRAAGSSRRPGSSSSSTTASGISQQQPADLEPVRPVRRTISGSSDGCSPRLQKAMLRGRRAELAGDRGEGVAAPHGVGQEGRRRQGRRPDERWDRRRPGHGRGRRRARPAVRAGRAGGSRTGSRGSPGAGHSRQPPAG